MPLRERVKASLGFNRPQKPHSSASRSEPSQRAPGGADTVQPAAGDGIQCLPVDDAPDGLWDQAYAILKDDQPELIAAYESTLSTHGRNESEQSTVQPSQLAATDREARLAAVLTDKNNAVIAARMKITFWPGKNVAVRDCFDKIVKKIVVAEGFIGQAVSGEPHAALAWAGVSMLLPLLLNPVQQDLAAWEGLDKVTDMLSKYRVVEVCLRDRSSSTLPEVDALYALVEQRIKKLFSMILEYQIRLVCHLTRSKAFQILRNLLVSDDWASLFTEIQALDKFIEDKLRTLDSQSIRTGIRLQSDQSAKILESAIQQDERLQSILQNISALHAGVASVDTKLADRWKVEDRERCVSAFRCDYDFDSGKRRIAKREKGTCSWFLQHHKFKWWRDSTVSGLLFVTAEPGCGKTVLSKYLIDSALEAPKDRHLCYWFFKDDTAPQRSATQALKALISQLLSRKKRLIDMILWHRKWRDRLSHISNAFGDLCDVLLACVRALGTEVVFIIDALDECGVEHRQLLIDTLNDFFRRAGREGGLLKVLMTGRPYFNVEFKFQNLISQLPLDAHLAGEDESQGDEMDVVIRSQVGSMDLSPHVKRFLIAKLITFQAKTRTFLLLETIFDNIRNNADLKNASEQRLARFIQDLPTSIFAAYEQFLERNTNRNQTELLFRIILAASRAMTVKEINTTFFIARNTDENFEGLGYAEWKDEMQPEADFKVTMRTLCGLFVTVIDEHVYLIHQTAREFLLGQHEHPDTGRPCSKSESVRWRHSIDLATSHLLISRACVIYLLMRDLEDSGTIPSFLNHSDISRRDPFFDEKDAIRNLYPFIDYATEHLIHHITRSLNVPILPQKTVKIFDLDSPRFWAVFQVRCIFSGKPPPAGRFLYDMIKHSGIPYKDLEDEDDLAVREEERECGLLTPNQLCWIASDGKRMARAKLDVEKWSIGREDRRIQYNRIATKPGSPRDRRGMMTPTDFASWQEGSEGLGAEDYVAWKLPEEEESEEYAFPLTLKKKASVPD